MFDYSPLLFDSRVHSGMSGPDGVLAVDLVQEEDRLESAFASTDLSVTLDVRDHHRRHWNATLT